MNEIITYSLVIFAAIFNAVMDRTENIVAFNRSIFSHLDPKFWCKDVSWKRKHEVMFKIKIPYITWKKSGKK